MTKDSFTLKLETLTDNELIITLVALALLLAGAYICGKLMEYIKAPKVVGEIVGGMIFSGTFLAHFNPELMQSIFQSYQGEGKVLNIFYHLGLILLMLSSGFNTTIDIRNENKKIILNTFLGATIIPMIIGLCFVKPFKQYFIGAKGEGIPFTLVFIIGIAITSIPVISKIFFDMGIMNTNFSNIVLTVSTIQDLCLWVMLNMATRIAKTGYIDIIDMLIVVVLTLAIFIVVGIISNKISIKITNKAKSIDFYTISLIVLLIICALLSQFGINIMYSAFLTGYVIKAISHNDIHSKIRMDALADIAFSFFVPIYFALVGIQLNLIHNFSPLRFIAFFAIAFSLEAFGTAIMLIFTKLKRITVLNFAITMNARGGPGIVLATVAYSAEIISVEFFTVLILTTMLSSLIAGYWLRLQQKRDSDIFNNIYKT